MSEDEKPALDSGSENYPVDKIKNIQIILISWGKENYSDFPWRSTENKFHALIAEIMLQRTRAEQVKGVFKNFIDEIPSLEVEMNFNRIREILSPLGLNWRIEKIIELIEVLKEKSTIPINYYELIELPGVGDYAASAYLSLHAGIRKPLIDSNATRLWGRLFGIKTGPETRRKRIFRKLVDKMTPTISFKSFNYAILDFTRTICKIKPLCDKCPLNNICIFNSTYL